MASQRDVLPPAKFDDFDGASQLFDVFLYLDSVYIVQLLADIRLSNRPCAAEGIGLCDGSEMRSLAVILSQNGSCLGKVRQWLAVQSATLFDSFTRRKEHARKAETTITCRRIDEPLVFLQPVPWK